MQYLGRYYVRYFNYRFQRTGTLFEGRFKGHLVQSNRYFLQCCRYIELNPVRAGMVADPADYKWSSYATHAFGQRVRMWTPHSEYCALGSDSRDRQQAYRNQFKTELGKDVLDDIRLSVNTGFVLGSKKFRQQVENFPVSRKLSKREGVRQMSQNCKFYFDGMDPAPYGINVP